MPARFRSMPVASCRFSCSDLPASSSRWARVMPTTFPAAVRQAYLQAAGLDDGQFVLADLVALRQVRVEVILAREDRARRISAPMARPNLHGHAHDVGVQHRQHARVAQVDEVGLRIGLGAVGRGRPEKILLRVASWAWISRPMTVSQLIVPPPAPAGASPSACWYWCAKFSTTVHRNGGR